MDFEMLWNPKTKRLNLTLLIVATSCNLIYCVGLVVISYMPSDQHLTSYGLLLIFVGHFILMIAALRNAHLSTATLETEDYNFTQKIEVNVSKRPNTYRPTKSEPFDFQIEERR